MFAKLSLMSFIFDMLEAFCFPDEKFQKILQKYMIEKVHIYHVLTTIDRFVSNLFLSSTQKAISAKKKNIYRDIIFEIIIGSKVYDRFGTSHQYWEKLDARKENLHKYLGYFEIEHINNPRVLMIAWNPKEY